MYKIEKFVKETLKDNYDAGVSYRLQGTTPP